MYLSAHCAVPQAVDSITVIYSEMRSPAVSVITGANCFQSVRNDLLNGTAERSERLCEWL